VQATPESVKILIKEGYTVRIESGAGTLASYTDAAYSAAGAEIVDTAAAWGSDIVLKVNEPTMAEVELSRVGGVLVSFIKPAQNPELVEALKGKGLTVVAMDCLPRTISRAQVCRGMRGDCSMHATLSLGGGGHGAPRSRASF
jgi:NAD(P) transhydrogenase subunit alpha